MQEYFLRTAMLIGADNLALLARSRIAVFGLGGVGSYVVEALARCGIGYFTLVDDDTVAPSNINRQLPATMNTIGMYKTQVTAQRIAQINPAAEVRMLNVFCTPQNAGQLLEGDYHYIVDAIDTVSAKIALAEAAVQNNIPIISAMGAGNKMDPTRFEVADIYKTSVCPLCRVMRRELKKRGIPSLKTVYSKEPPLAPIAFQDSGQNEPALHQKRQTPGSIAFVPSVAGLIIAGEVVKDLIGHTPN